MDPYSKQTFNAEAQPFKPTASIHNTQSIIQALTRENACQRQRLQLLSDDLNNKALQLRQRGFEVAEQQHLGHEKVKENNALHAQLKRQESRLLQIEQVEEDFGAKEKAYIAEIAALKEELKKEKAAKDRRPSRRSVQGLKKEVEELKEASEIREQQVVIEKLVLTFVLRLLYNYSTSLRMQRESLRLEVAELAASNETNISKNQELQEELTTKTEENGDLQQKVDEFEQLIQLYKGVDHWIPIEKGNRAAHDGDCRLDCTLFTVGAFDDAELQYCNQKYGQNLERFIGSSETLKPLIEWRLRTKMWNLHAYIDTETKKGRIITNDLQRALSTFQKLEGELQDYLISLDWQYDSQEEARMEFENDSGAKAKVEEMSRIVRAFRKSRCKKAQLENSKQE
ncbi:hypothetical protein N431DRAFT_450653 [Stipitochalara longipes BDJ]|nr:hypothetical protein N431DRAFT_450653 [Stipitochalara longipes BDJ]